MMKHLAVVAPIASILFLTCNTPVNTPEEIPPDDVSLTISPEPINGAVSVNPPGTKVGALWMVDNPF
jgi:hypothetical protein